jgi:hypothetical protein
MGKKISAIINNDNEIFAYSPCHENIDAKSGKVTYRHSIGVTPIQEKMGYRLLMIDEDDLPSDLDLGYAYYDDTEVDEKKKWKFSQNKKDREELSIIRDERNNAFAIGDKYQLPFLYNNLTEKQKKDYEKWRNDWLDATETKVMPELLDWMKP